jgi:hypothetical protein
MAASSGSQIEAMDWRKLGSGLWEFVSVLALSLIVGIGIGFFQGELSTGAERGDIRMVLPNEGALTGALLGVPTGLFAYYVLLGRKVSFRIFRSIVAVIAIISTITGLTVGYATKGEAAFASSILMIPLSLIAIGVIAAKFREPQPE